MNTPVGRTMGKRNVEFDFKELNILKHALQDYISREEVTEKDKKEELNVINKVESILDTMYFRRNIC